MQERHDTTVWGANTQISMPRPPSTPVLFDMGGFGITEYGLAHNIDVVSIENYIPTFLPLGRSQ